MKRDPVMPANQPTPLTTVQAIDRARWMISSGQKLSRAAEVVSEARSNAARSAAEELKETQLLNYRVSTVPESLEPVLEALIQAASSALPNKAAVNAAMALADEWQCDAERAEHHLDLGGRIDNKGVREAKAQGEAGELLRAALSAALDGDQPTCTPQSQRASNPS